MKLSKSNKKSFLLYKDSLEIFEHLSDEECGKIFKSMINYQLYEIENELDFHLKLVLIPFLNQFKRDNEIWNKKSKINAINGCKGGKAKLANASEFKRTPKNLATSSESSRYVSVSVSDSVKDKDSVNVNVKENDIIKKINNKKNEPWEIQSIIDYFNSAFQTNKYAKGSDRQKICKYIEEMLSHGDDYTDIKLLIDYKKSNPNTKNIDLTSWLNTKYVGDNMAKAKDWFNNGCNEIKKYSDNQTQRGYEPMPDFGNTIFLDSIIEDDKADENV